MNITLTPTEIYNKWYSRNALHLTIADYAHIMELYITEIKETEICERYMIHRDVLYYIVSLYYKKPDFELTLVSRV
jgi:hypothetical protein